jgi:hypothetical protein
VGFKETPSTKPKKHRRNNEQPNRGILGAAALNFFQSFLLWLLRFLREWVCFIHN